MRKLLTFIVVLLMINIAFAAVPPYAQMHVFYEDKLIEGEISGEFLDCYEESADYGRESYQQPVAPELASINEYDEENNCTWRPMDYLRSGACKVSMCEFFPIPYWNARFAVYVHDLDRTFVTETIHTHDNLHYFWVFLKEDGSAAIEETRRLDMTPFYAAFENEEDNGTVQPEPPEKKVPAYAYILAVLIIAGLVLWLKKVNKPKKKRRKRR